MIPVSGSDDKVKVKRVSVAGLGDNVSGTSDIKVGVDTPSSSRADNTLPDVLAKLRLLMIRKKDVDASVRSNETRSIVKGSRLGYLSGGKDKPYTNTTRSFSRKGAFRAKGKQADNVRGTIYKESASASLATSVSVYEKEDNVGNFTRASPQKGEARSRCVKNKSKFSDVEGIAATYKDVGY